MKRDGGVPVPRGWTGRAAWKGAGASLLLHLFAGAALIAALSGPPRPAPQVIDLTFLPPSRIDPHPAPPGIVTAAEPAGNRGTAVLPAPLALPDPPAVVDTAAPSAPPAVAGPPGGTAPAEPRPPAATAGAPFPHTPQVGS